MQQIMRLVDFVCSFTALISMIFSLYVFFLISAVWYITSLPPKLLTTSFTSLFQQKIAAQLLFHCHKQITISCYWILSLPLCCVYLFMFPYFSVFKSSFTPPLMFLSELTWSVILVCYNHLISSKIWVIITITQVIIFIFCGTSFIRCS